MHLPILTLTLTLLLNHLSLSAAIAVPAPNPNSALEAKDLIPNTVLRQVVPRQGIPLPEPLEDIDPREMMEDNVPPFSNSVAFCPYPGTAYCCNPNPGTGGTLCKWNGDGHLAGCELITGGESVCCCTLGCKGMSGLREPITTV
ncbi:hypothetical protein H4I96_05555 [Botrytis cinerea]